MRTTILSIAAVAALATPAVAEETDNEAVELTETHQNVIDAAGNMLVAMAESKLADMANLQPQDFITDDMVRASVREYNWGSWRGVSRGAREHVFGEFQCSIFEHFEDADKECGHVLSYESESGQWNERYEKNHSLPAELPVFSREARRIIYSVGRSYLKSPENLRATYDTHVDVAVDEFNRLFFADQQKFRTMLETMLSAIEESRNPTVREVIVAERDARQKMSFERRHDAQSEAFKEAREVYDSAVAARQAAVSDLESVEFIYRRFAEGGPDLVAMYEEIFTDLLNRISAS